MKMQPPKAEFDLATARAITTAPQTHSDQGLRRAIDVLKSCGDWVDFERARLLERQLDAEALPSTWWVALWDALDCIALFLLAVAGFWIGCGLGWS